MATRKRKPRVSKKPGLKTSVTTPDRVKVIVELMVANFQAKATAIMGAASASGGVGFGGRRYKEKAQGGLGTPFDHSVDEADYISEWDEKIPPMSASSGGDWQESGARPVARTLRLAGLMTLEKGAKVIDSTAARLVTFCRAALSGEKPSWRRWMTFGAALKVVEWERTKARAELKLAALPKGERKGWQRISTTRTTRLPAGRLVTFSGKPAWSGARGRPPLPESEWLNRYRSRLQKRRAKYPGKRRRIGRKPLPPRLDGKPRKVRKARPKKRPVVPKIPVTAGVRPPYTLRLPDR
jgi:hypothetical protein